MTDLDNAALRVKLPESRELIKEAIRAYGSGAFRAAIACAWVAVVTDIRLKIHSLADDEGEAKAWVRTFDNALEDLNSSKPQHYEVQKLEEGILEFAHEKIEILTARELEEMKRLKRDRNLCVHPNSLATGEIFSPSAELARVHIITAIDSLLSQRARVGKSLISILANEMQGDGWPEQEEVDRYFLDRFFKSARSATRNALVSVIIKNSMCEEVSERKVEDRTAFRCRYLARVLARECPSTFEEQLRKELDKMEEHGIRENDLMRCVGAFGFFGEFRKSLPSTAFARLKAISKNAECNALVENHYFAGGIPIDSELSDTFKARVTDLSTGELTKVIKQTTDPHCLGYLIDHAINLVESSEDYESAGKSIQNISHMAADMNVREVNLLKNAIVNNKRDQVIPAYNTPKFLISTFRGRESNDPKLLEAWKGLVECAMKAGGEAPGRDTWSWWDDLDYPSLKGQIDEALNAHS